MTLTNTSDLLDSYLVSYDENLAKYKKLPKRQTIDLIELILKRYTWLRENDRELPDAHVARLRLARLLSVLHSVKKLRCTEADLRMMLDLTTPLLDYIAADGPVDHVMEYLKDNDLTPELCQSLHNYQSNLQEAGSASAMLSLRQRLHTILFMDEWEPLKPSKCWSESIRRDFRAMKGKRKENWRRLLKHIRGNAPKNIPAAWSKEATERLAAVGIDDFNNQLAVWFEPFRSGEPLPLSVAGSHVLKGLVWYVAVSGDETAKQTALWLLEVKWKQKRNMEKAMTALEVLGVSEKELIEQKFVKAPPVPDPMLLQSALADLRSMGEKISVALKDPTQAGNVLQQLFADLENPQTPLMQKVAKNKHVKFVMSTGVQMDHDEGVMIVQGERHFYRVFPSDGRIERATDNAELELNWEAIPDGVRVLLQQSKDFMFGEFGPMISYLRQDSLYSKYFRVKAAAD